jgi:hypothetical protein
METKVLKWVIPADVVKKLESQGHLSLTTDLLYSFDAVQTALIDLGHKDIISPLLNKLSDNDSLYGSIYRDDDKK